MGHTITKQDNSAYNQVEHVISLCRAIRRLAIRPRAAAAWETCASEHRP